MFNLESSIADDIIEHCQDRFPLIYFSEHSLKLVKVKIYNLLITLSALHRRLYMITQVLSSAVCLF